MKALRVVIGISILTSAIVSHALLWNRAFDAIYIGDLAFLMKTYDIGAYLLASYLLITTYSLSMYLIIPDGEVLKVTCPDEKEPDLAWFAQRDKELEAWSASNPSEDIGFTASLWPQRPQCRGGLVVELAQSA